MLGFPYADQRKCQNRNNNLTPDPPLTSFPVPSPFLLPPLPPYLLLFSFILPLYQNQRETTHLIRTREALPISSEPERHHPSHQNQRGTTHLIRIGEAPRFRIITCSRQRVKKKICIRHWLIGLHGAGTGSYGVGTGSNGVGTGSHVGCTGSHGGRYWISRGRDCITRSRYWITQGRCWVTRGRYWITRGQVQDHTGEERDHMGAITGLHSLIANT